MCGCAFLAPLQLRIIPGVASFSTTLLLLVFICTLLGFASFGANDSREDLVRWHCLAFALV